jgi:hypothetical protein
MPLEGRSGVGVESRGCQLPVDTLAHAEDRQESCDWQNSDRASSGGNHWKR